MHDGYTGVSWETVKEQTIWIKLYSDPVKTVPEACEMLKKLFLLTPCMQLKPPNAVQVSVTKLRLRILNVHVAALQVRLTKMWKCVPNHIWEYRMKDVCNILSVLYGTC